MITSDVGPSKPVDKLPHVLRTNPKETGYVDLSTSRMEQAAYLKDLIDCQTRSVMAFSAGNAFGMGMHPMCASAHRVIDRLQCCECRATHRSPLRLAVGGIVGARAKPQMIWTNAVANIASVQDAQITGNVAICKLPSEAMGAYVSLLPQREASVAVPIGGSLPHPTVARRIDFGPESNCGRDSLEAHRDAPYRGAMPPVAPNYAGALTCRFYSDESRSI